MTVTELLSFYAPGTTFADVLYEHSQPDDTVAWHIAVEATEMHGRNQEFVSRFKRANGANISTSELLKWLGY